MALSTVAAWFCSFLITFNIRDCKEGQYKLPDSGTLSKCTLPKIDHLNVIEYVDPNDVIKDSHQIFVANTVSNYFSDMTIFFNCTDGYTPNKMSLTCKKRFDVFETAEWSGDLPKCGTKIVNTILALSVNVYQVPNICKWKDTYKAVFTYEDQLLPTFSKSRSFPDGTMARYLDGYCMPGYRVKHASMLTRHCNQSGYWTGPKPQCELIGSSFTSNDEHSTEGSSSTSPYVKDENSSEVPAERTSWWILTIVMTSVSLFLLLSIALYFITRWIKSDKNQTVIPRLRFVTSPPVASGTLDRIVSEANLSENSYETIAEVGSPYQTISEITNGMSPNNINDYDKPKYAFPIPKAERGKFDRRINPFDV